MAQQDPEVAHFFLVEAQPEKAARAKTAVIAIVRAFFIRGTLNRLFRLASVLLATLIFASCASRQPRPDSVATYQAFLRSHPGADLRGAKEDAAVRRFQDFLSAFTEEKLRRDTRRVYAQDAYLNDTLKTLRGSAAIEEYFLGTLANTESITVTFSDVARSGNEYYFRWVMDVRFKKFQRGETIRTIGMTHVRFNREGQVILHQDYWDSAQGLFEHVPVIGTGIQLIKSRL